MKFRVSILIVMIILLLGGTLYLFLGTKNEEENQYINIPVASQTLNIYDEITEEDIKYISVYKDLVTSNVITEAEKLIGTYITSDVYENGFFYENILIDNPFNILEHDNLFIIEVPSEYQSTIREYNFIDIWLDGQMNNYTLITPWIENVSILYYLDSNNKITTSDKRVNKIALNVPDDIYEKLTKVEEDGSYNLEVVIKGLSEPTDENIINNVVEQLILNDILN